MDKTQGFSLVYAGCSAYQCFNRRTAAPPGQSKHTRKGRGPDRTVNVAEDGLRPGPVHDCFNFICPGCARPMKSQ